MNNNQSRGTEFITQLTQLIQLHLSSMSICFLNLTVFRWPTVDETALITQYTVRSFNWFSPWFSFVWNLKSDVFMSLSEIKSRIPAAGQVNGVWIKDLVSCKLIIKSTWIISFVVMPSVLVMSGGFHIYVIAMAAVPSSFRMLLC